MKFMETCGDRKQYKNVKNDVSWRYVRIINIIRILKWGWLSLIFSKICDTKKTFLMGTTNGTPKMTCGNFFKVRKE